MQIPADVTTLIDTTTDIKAARDMQLSVSVYIDDTASADLVAHVRGAFASTASSVRMTISYLDHNFMPQVDDDIAVIVAGESVKVGAAAKAIRALNVPVMVVSLSPSAVDALAKAAGSAIPDGDIVAPFEVDEEHEEPFELTDDAIKELDMRMGRWIVAVCREKRLAFAIAFPFMRRPLALDAVQATSLQNAGIGLVPLIPGADLPVITLNQIKMVMQIAAAYGHDMDKSSLKELIAIIGNAFLCRTLARELAEFVPVLGFIIRTGVAYGGTAALGHAVIEYYEGGENATGLANVAERAVETGAKVLTKVRGAAADPSSIDVVGKVSGYVPVVRETVGKYVPVVRDAVGKFVPTVANAAADILSKAAAK